MLGAVILEVCGYVFSRAEFALLGSFELYLLVFWGVCAGGSFVRGGLLVVGLWTLWILFSCGVGASSSVVVADFVVVQVIDFVVAGANGLIFIFDL